MALTTGQRWGIAAVVSLAAHGVVLAVATRRAPVPEAPRGGVPTQFVPIFDGHPPAAGGGSAKVLEPQRAPVPARLAAAPAAPTAEPKEAPAPSSAAALAAPAAAPAPEGTTASSNGTPAGSADAGSGSGTGTGSGGMGASSGTGVGTGTGPGTGSGTPTDDCRVEVGRQLAERARAEVPRAVRDRGLVGQVVLTFAVGDGGVVEGARIEASSGHPLLDEAALALLARPLATECRGQYRLPFLWHLPARR